MGYWDSFAQAANTTYGLVEKVSSAREKSAEKRKKEEDAQVKGEAIEMMLSAKNPAAAVSDPLRFLKERGKAYLAGEIFSGEAGKQVMAFSKQQLAGQVSPYMPSLVHATTSQDYSDPGLIDSARAMVKMIPGFNSETVDVKQINPKTGLMEVVDGDKGTVLSIPQLTFMASTVFQEEDEPYRQLLLHSSKADIDVSKSRRQAGITGSLEREKAGLKGALTEAEYEQRASLEERKGRIAAGLQEQKAGDARSLQEDRPVKRERVTDAEGNIYSVNPYDPSDTVPLTTGGAGGLEGTVGIARPGLDVRVPVRARQPQQPQDVVIDGKRVPKVIADASLREANASGEDIGEVLQRNISAARREGLMPPLPQRPARQNPNAALESADPTLQSAGAALGGQGKGVHIRNPETGQEAYMYPDGRVVDARTGERLR